MSVNDPYPPAYVPPDPGVPGYAPTPPVPTYGSPSPDIPASAAATAALPAVSAGGSEWDRPAPPAGTGDQPSTAQVAKDKAVDVAGGTAEAAKNVASTAKDQVAQVAGTAGEQARQLWQQTQSELSDQAQGQQQRLAAGLHSLGDQLHSMASTSDTPGMVTDLVREGADRAHRVAEWFDGRDPQGVVAEVRRYAARRPGLFLALAVGAGVAAGRLARNLAADPDELAARNGSDGRSAGRPPGAVAALGPASGSGSSGAGSYGTGSYGTGSYGPASYGSGSYGSGSYGSGSGPDAATGAADGPYGAAGTGGATGAPDPWLPSRPAGERAL